MSADTDRLDDLVWLAERVAERDRDGHLTLLRFTIGWKVLLGTPNLDHGGERDRVWELRSFGELETALLQFVGDRATPAEITTWLVQLYRARRQAHLALDAEESER